MKLVRASMAVVMLIGASLAGFAGCGTDPLPPDSPTGGGGNGGGAGGGVPTTCGDGKLEADKGEACDDGNNVSDDGCSACVVDECYTCTADAGALSACMTAATGAICQETKVCDGAGSCVECVDDAQCSGGGYCHENVCAKCDDTIMNGDETDADCGGTHCGKCDDGKLCGVSDDCNSTFCVDGVCCFQACDEACLACNIAGFEGACEFVPKYEEDQSYGMGESCTMATGKVCSGSGVCAGKFGEPCASSPGCASLKCADTDNDGSKTCAKTTGDACTDNLECFNSMCDPATMKCL
jgi:hypothetical protein